MNYNMMRDGEAVTAEQATVRPFIKWAGGKTQLLPELMSRVPAQFGRYHEPFIGSAALFFRLHSLGKLRHQSILSDANQALIELYRVVRDDVEELLAALQVHAGHATDRDYYYAVRDWDRQPDWARRTPVERAARMLFLNKTCFNGLHRVNQRGYFNVPFGRYDNPKLGSPANLRAASRALQGVELLVDDFSGVLRRAESGDLIYFDPPYLPVSATAAFTAYTRDPFGVHEHRRLAQIFTALAERGCTVLLSNSHTPLTYELYNRFTIAEISARRAINSVAAKRGAVREVLVQSIAATPLEQVLKHSSKP